MVTETSNLVDISRRNLSPVSLKTETGLWEDLLSDDCNISTTLPLPNLRRHIYITTPHGLVRRLHESEEPVIGIVLPRRYTTLFNTDNVISFMLHGIEDIKDYKLFNKVVINRKDLKVKSPFETISIQNKNGTLDVLLPAESHRNQDAVWSFMREKGYCPGQFFSIDRFY
ncbi:MAG: hypothetical protein ACLFPL_05070 [Candidatus Nanoarchaeia archaeon]